MRMIFKIESCVKPSCMKKFYVIVLCLTRGASKMFPQSAKCLNIPHPVVLEQFDEIKKVEKCRISSTYLIINSFSHYVQFLVIKQSITPCIIFLLKRDFCPHTSFRDIRAVVGDGGVEVHLEKVRCLVAKGKYMFVLAASFIRVPHKNWWTLTSQNGIGVLSNSFGTYCLLGGRGVCLWISRDRHDNRFTSTLH